MDKIKVELIDKPYVKDDGVLVMLPFEDGLNVFEYKNGNELFRFVKNDHKYKNLYLDDERRKEFPYGNIPVHKTIKNFKVYNVANQIFDYGTIYKIVYFTKNNDFVDPDLSDSNVLEKACYKNSEYTYSTCYSSVIKDNDRAFLVVSKKECLPELEMTPEELKSLRSLNKVEFTKAYDPKIYRFLNTGISKKELEDAKKLIKK